MDLDALSELGKNVPGFELTHLPSVHAKVYVADWRMAIVTSGNLTQPGLCGNIEYGVALSDESMVKQVRSDVEGYASLGAKVSIDDIAALSAEMQHLRRSFSRQKDRSAHRLDERLGKNLRPRISDYCATGRRGKRPTRSSRIQSDFYSQRALYGPKSSTR